VLPSLLAWDPTRYGLPAFKDLIESVIPLNPAFYIKGKVVKGFGRGSKVGEPLLAALCTAAARLSIVQHSSCTKEVCCRVLSLHTHTGGASWDLPIALSYPETLSNQAHSYVYTILRH